MLKIDSFFSKKQYLTHPHPPASGRGLVRFKKRRISKKNTTKLTLTTDKSKGVRLPNSLVLYVDYGWLYSTH